MDFRKTNSELLDELYYRARSRRTNAEIPNGGRTAEVYNQLRDSRLSVQEQHRLLSIRDEFPMFFS